MSAPMLWETAAFGLVLVFTKAFFFEVLSLGPFGLVLYGYPLLLLISPSYLGSTE